MGTDAISIVLAGDLVLDEPDGAYWLSGIAPALREADLAVGHLEVPHTNRGAELKGDVPAPGAPPPWRPQRRAYQKARLWVRRRVGPPGE